MAKRYFQGEDPDHLRVLRGLLHATANEHAGFGKLACLGGVIDLGDAATIGRLDAAAREAARLALVHLAESPNATVEDVAAHVVRNFDAIRRAAR